MRSRALSTVLGVVMLGAGMAGVVARPAGAAEPPRLFLHGTAATYLADFAGDPTAVAGFAPKGVFADPTAPTGTTDKTGQASDLTGSPGVPNAPTWSLGFEGMLKTACVDLWVEGFNAGATFPVYLGFGQGDPVRGAWSFPPPPAAAGTGVARVTAMLTLAAPFAMTKTSTLFFFVSSNPPPDPTARPFTVHYDSAAHASNVTLNPTTCTPAAAGGGAPAPSAAASAPASAEPSAAPSTEPSATPASSAPSAEPSASESASPTAAASPVKGSCDGAEPSAGASASEEASASASASPSGGGGLPSLQPKAGSDQANGAVIGDEPARDETSCRVTSITLKTNATQVTAGNAPILSGVARDGRGDAVEGATITIFTKGYGETKYTAAATVKTDSAGQYKISVRPLKQTSMGANVGGAKSPIISIKVNTRINISTPTPGGAESQETFTGNLSPGYANVAVGLGYLANGRFVVLTQRATDGAGRYAIPARLPRGTHAFVVFTSAHQGTDKGSRSVELSVR